MALPRKLKNFAIFKDGVNFMGEIPEVTLPTLTRQMEDYRSGGMNAPLKQDFGMEALSAELKAAGYMAELISGFGAGRHDATMLRFAGAAQGEDGENPQAVEVVMRGRISEIDMGSAKAGEGTEHTYKYELSYYKLVLDGQVVLEIDILNMVEVVNGVDNLAATRAALGI